MLTKIVIANTLKPVDDVRGYEKIAQSIAKTNKYQVNIIGNTGKKLSDHPSIRFFQHSLSRKNFLIRIQGRIKTMFRILSLKPKVLIVQTHELLYAALICKLLMSCKIVYDVREDYKKNLLFLSRWPYPIRFILAFGIRAKERLLTPFIDQFWLAEKCYLYEISFPKSRSIILENKALEISEIGEKITEFNCLFTGTVSNYGGVQLAVNAFQEIKKQVPNCTLTITGQCHDSKLKTELENAAIMDKNINLSISTNSVDHAEIIRHIQKATVGMISYQPNDVNKNKIPTKLYEYSLYQLPYLIQENTPWLQKGKSLGGAIPVDFQNPNGSFIFKQLQESGNLFHSTYPDSETWQSQESLVQDSLKTLVKDNK